MSKNHRRSIEHNSIADFSTNYFELVFYTTAPKRDIFGHVRHLFDESSKESSYSTPATALIHLSNVFQLNA